MTPERLTQIREFIRRYGSANCWTGTLGTACAMIHELLAEIEERNEEALERSERATADTEAGYDGAGQGSQSELCRVADGLASARVDRLRAAGNGCCPQAVAAAFVQLLACLDGGGGV